MRRRLWMCVKCLGNSLSVLQGRWSRTSAPPLLGKEVCCLAWWSGMWWGTLGMPAKTQKLETNWISTTLNTCFNVVRLYFQLLNIWALSPVLLGRWHIRRRLGRWRWVGRWRNGALEERGPSSWHWIARRIYPKSPGKTASACKQHNYICNK